MSGIYARHWPGEPTRPALALHCMMASSAYWDPIHDRLGGRVDLRAFDMPGHGRSGPWRAEPGVDFHTAVTRIAARMIDRPLDLIGHSIGATVALRIAVGAPEAVRSLTLIEPVLFAAAPDAGGAASESRLDRLMAEGRDTEAARAFLSLWGAEGGFDANPPAVQAAMTRQMALVMDTMGALVHDTARLLRPHGLEGIDAPVMLILGAKSPPVIPAIAEALAARMGDVGIASVPGAGHMAPMTHPDAVAGLIAANLDRA